ncbi:hypothetical protein [Paludisphaera mucosa]|uniref:Uncharacterized protein n=1 Tax=Paludisphaera mucosa TaxID=3030827 RepID=A0ABT6FA87_9BACT|nr:hypothetical protein [Paludisphaera mucosa]MDG3004469.1 hypothetical protein [Paludisphaera mucosa]
MAAEPHVVEVPPGEYSVPGVDRILIIQGVAFWRAPAEPTDLTSLVPAASPTDLVAPESAGAEIGWTSHADAPGRPSLLTTAILALAAAACGAWVLPGLGSWIAPAAPPAVATSAPAATPPTGPGPFR